MTVEKQLYNDSLVSPKYPSQVKTETANLVESFKRLVEKQK